MKTKYLGVTALIIAAVSIVVAGLIFTLVNFHPQPLFGDRAQPPRTLSAAETRRLQTLEYYTESLERVFSEAQTVPATYVSMFPGRAPAPAPGSSFRARELAMVYRAPNDAYALIDNRLYREGDTLPGDARLVSIETDSVWLIESGQRRQLRVNRSTGTGPVSMVTSSNVRQ